MWFDNKTPAEINERLQNEGVLARLINAAKGKRYEKRGIRLTRDSWKTAVVT